LLNKLFNIKGPSFFLPKDREAPAEVGLEDKSLIDKEKSVVGNYLSHVWHPFK